MECPHCKDYLLEPNEIEPGLIANSCNRCGGALLSLSNYRFWADQLGDFVKANPDEVVAEDNTGAHQCPMCRRLMTKYTIGVESENKLDLCSNCDEAWMDNGEWRLLKVLDLHGKLPAIFTDAWQRNIREKRAAINYIERFKQQVGEDDSQKAIEFKQWLDAHPERDRIRNFLNATD